MARYIIDVREPEEYAAGHVKAAVNIPLSELTAGTEKLKVIPKDTEIVGYCVSGRRSGLFKNILESKGYTNVLNGINEDHIQDLLKDS